MARDGWYRPRKTVSLPARGVRRLPSKRALSGRSRRLQARFTATTENAERLFSWVRKMPSSPTGCGRRRPPDSPEALSRRLSPRSNQRLPRAQRRAGAPLLRARAALASEGVGGEHGVDEHRGMDLEGHVMDGLAFDARRRRPSRAPRGTPSSPMISRATGRPTSRQKSTTSSTTSAGRSSSMSMVITPRPPSPRASSGGCLQSSQAVVDGVRRPEPPDSKPSPESRVFASTTFSTAVTAPALPQAGPRARAPAGCRSTAWRWRGLPASARRRPSSACACAKETPSIGRITMGTYQLPGRR